MTKKIGITAFTAQEVATLAVGMWAWNNVSPVLGIIVWFVGLWLEHAWAFNVGRGARFLADPDRM